MGSGNLSLGKLLQLILTWYPEKPNHVRLEQKGWGTEMVLATQRLLQKGGEGTTSGFTVPPYGARTPRFEACCTLVTVRFHLPRRLLRQERSVSSAPCLHLVSAHQQLRSSSLGTLMRDSQALPQVLPFPVSTQPTTHHPT